MNKIEFRKIAFGNWERVAQGTIVGNGIYLEIQTESEAVLNFLFRYRASREIISDPVVWVGESYYVHTGAFEVIHMDDHGTVLRKLK